MTYITAVKMRRVLWSTNTESSVKNFSQVSTCSPAIAMQENVNARAPKNLYIQVCAQVLCTSSIYMKLLTSMHLLYKFKQNYFLKIHYLLCSYLVHVLN